MNAEQMIQLADTLRAHALRSGADLNASNLFVHRVLIRTMHADGAEDEFDMELTELDAEVSGARRRAPDE